jgi:pimeloyl-ACP methyl ester carboxylesterase
MSLNVDLLRYSGLELKELFVDYINAYILLHTDTPPIIVGHSFGGFIISELICKYKKLCKSAIFVNACGIFPILGKETMMWGAIFKSGFPYYYTRKLRYINNIIYFYRSMFIDENDISPIFHWYYLLANSQDNIGETLVSRFIHYDGFTCYMKYSTLSKLLTTDTCPISVICGIYDPIVPLWGAQILSKFSYKKDRIKVFYIECGHNLIITSSSLTYILNNSIKGTKNTLFLRNNKTIIDKEMDSYRATCDFTDTQCVIDKMYKYLRKLSKTKYLIRNRGV